MLQGVSRTGECICLKVPVHWVIGHIRVQLRKNGLIMHINLPIGLKMVCGCKLFFSGINKNFELKNLSLYQMGSSCEPSFKNIGFTKTLRTFAETRLFKGTFVKCLANISKITISYSLSSYVLIISPPLYQYIPIPKGPKQEAIAVQRHYVLTCVCCTHNASTFV